MATKLYYNPFVPAFSNIGVPIAESKLYFYYTLTNTLAPIYSDAAASVPLTNPVVANLAGKYPDIYLDESVVYRIIQTDKNDAQIGDEVDPYIPGQAMKGEPGPAGNVAANLTQLKTQNPTDVAVIYDGAIYVWTLGNFTGRANDVTIVQSASTPITTGAWVRSKSFITPQMFGAKGDGVTDDWAAFTAARTAANGNKIYVPAGTYKFTKAFTSSEDLYMEGDGEDTVLDFSGTITGGNYAVDAVGTATLIQTLSGTQNEGSMTVVFTSAPSLSVGDVFVIHNPTSFSWSGFRTDYQAGEWCEVESIVGSTVTLKSPLYDTYVGTSVNVYKISGPKVCLKNFKIKGTTVLGTLRTLYCINPIVEHLVIENENDVAHYIDRCFKPIVINPNYKNLGDGGDDYGLAIGNSQHVRVLGGNLYSRRHAITHGGNSGVAVVPVRDSRIIGVTMKNDTASDAQTLDWHGNSEDCSVSESAIYGGINFGGKDITVFNSRITSDNGGRCVYHSEVKGGKFGLKNCSLSTFINPDLNGRSIFDVGANNTAITSNTVLPCTFFVHNCDVVGRNLTSSTIFCRFTNSGSTAAMNFEFDRLSGDFNSLGTILRTQLNSGTAASNKIVINNLSGFPNGTALHVAVGNAYLNFPHRLQRQSGSETLSAATGTNTTSGTTVTFKYLYPRIPNAVAGGSTSFNGNVVAVPSINLLSTSQIRPALYSVSATNWSATSNYTVNWSVEISEVS